ncbi:hypothetical protein BGZ47_000817 [Haplosporangium gracile]|nr:hypothetical protein BGZ47_000817 [Haplosporangium gracile]
MEARSCRSTSQSRLLIGANKEEGYSLDNDFGERTLKTWPRLLNSFVPSPELVPLYEAAYGIPKADEDVRPIMTEHLSGIVFHYPIERAVNTLIQVKQAREDAFALKRYHFKIPTQATTKDYPNSGSMHGAELLILFNPLMNENVFTSSERAAATGGPKTIIALG